MLILKMIFACSVNKKRLENKQQLVTIDKSDCFLYFKNFLYFI